MDLQFKAWSLFYTVQKLYSPVPGDIHIETYKFVEAFQDIFSVGYLHKRELRLNK